MKNFLIISSCILIFATSCSKEKIKDFNYVGDFSIESTAQMDTITDWTVSSINFDVEDEVLLLLAKSEFKNYKSFNLNSLTIYDVRIEPSISSYGLGIIDSVMINLNGNTIIKAESNFQGGYSPIYFQEVDFSSTDALWLTNNTYVSSYLKPKPSSPANFMAYYKVTYTFTANISGTIEQEK